MARLSRLSLPRELHYVVQRGRGSPAVFGHMADRVAYLEALRESAAQHGVAIHAYALRDDEAHWVATPADALALGRTVQTLGRRFVPGFNQRHATRGTCWDGRFRSCVVEATTHGLDLIVHVDRLAGPTVGDGGVETAEVDASRSTAPHHLGLERIPSLVDAPVWWALGNTPFDRESAFSLLYQRGLTIQKSEQFQRSVARGWVLGSAEFLAACVDNAGARPVVPRRRGRPRKRVL